MFLYSVNVFLKYHIQQLYYGDIHYVWCSENYDSRLFGAHQPESMVPPTSNPAEIYEGLKRAIARADRHDYKIADQRSSISSYALKACINGIITESQRDEIILLSDSPLSFMWRPVVYTINKSLVEARLHTVPFDERAGYGAEYIIKDLKRSEFTITEP